jgi:hypothetical protein
MRVLGDISDAKRADVYKQPSFNILNEGRTAFRCRNDDIPKFTLVIESRKVSLVEGLIVSVGKIKRLFEVCFNVFKHDIPLGFSRFVLIDVEQHILIDQIDAIVLSGGGEVDKTRIAREMYLLVLYLGGMAVFGLRDGVERG